MDNFDLRKYLAEGKLKDEVEALVRDLDKEEYEVFAFDNDVDPEDANQMMDFIMHLSNKDAKAIIKQLSKSVNEEMAVFSSEEEEDKIIKIR